MGRSVCVCVCVLGGGRCAQETQWLYTVTDIRIVYVDNIHSQMSREGYIIFSPAFFLAVCMSLAVDEENVMSFNIASQ
jgi:hypothetical protein